MNNSQIIQSHYSASYKLPFISKVYIWSITLEPLLFFAVAEAFYGISTNISRLFQFTFLLLFLMKLPLLRQWFIPSPLSDKYIWYLIYFLTAIASGVYGIYYGAYQISFLPASESAFVTFYRPVFEYFITIYYFCYFVILPRYIFNSNKAINYFFSVFTKFFYFSLIIGLLDLVVQKLSGGVYLGIPRHIGDLQAAPMRFHGIAGEPRDAFAYLIFGLGILWIKDLWYQEKKLNKFVFFIVIVAALLSQSASGLLGLVVSSMMLLIFFYLPRFSITKILRFFIIFIFLIALFALGVNYSPRLMLYYESFQELYALLEAGMQVRSALEVAMNNIYPLWHRWTEIQDLNFLPFIFGTGLGTSSVVNIIYFGVNELSNTNSNLVRTIFENGIVGTLILIFAFLQPIKSYKLPNDIKNQWLIYMIFILGAFLAHRTANPFIFLGVTSAIFSMIILKRYSNNSNNQ